MGIHFTTATPAKVSLDLLTDNAQCTYGSGFWSDYSALEQLVPVSAASASAAVSRNFEEWPIEMMHNEYFNLFSLYCIFHILYKLFHIKNNVNINVNAEC